MGIAEAHYRIMYKLSNWTA